MRAISSLDAAFSNKRLKEFLANLKGLLTRFHYFPNDNNVWCNILFMLGKHQSMENFAILNSQKLESG